MWDLITHTIKDNINNTKSTIKWSVFALISGIVVGSCATLFYFSMSFVTSLREHYPYLIFLLPIGGLFIVGAYKIMRDENDGGTNLVISAIHSGDHLPFRMAPLIFLSTLITHLFGGSAGREGAALQLGGSIGNGIGRLFKFDEKDKHIMIMCGMSASFSAIFGTPMAAAIFSMEVVSVGIMHYSALVPCVVASLIACGISRNAGAVPETFSINNMPYFNVPSALNTVFFVFICELISILFCIILHQSSHLYKKYIKNPYIRVFAGGCIIIVLTFIVGNQTYNGSGMNIVKQCFEGTVRPEVFFIKMIFTALTLGAGYKGGEIVPSFSIGAAFGCLFGNITGFSPDLCTALGMSAVFCGVTNCPITSLLISFELFGYEGMPYFLLTIAFSYMLSGYFGLYHSQKIIYSKYKTQFINKEAE